MCKCCGNGVCDICTGEIKKKGRDKGGGAPSRWIIAPALSLLTLVSCTSTKSPADKLLTDMQKTNTIEELVVLVEQSKRLYKFDGGEDVRLDNAKILCAQTASLNVALVDALSSFGGGLSDEEIKVVLDDFHEKISKCTKLGEAQ